MKMDDDDDILVNLIMNSGIDNYPHNEKSGEWSDESLFG